MTKLSESIIGKIKCDKIVPVPKWHFLVKKCSFWTMFFVSMVLGSFSFSVMMHISKSGDLDLIEHLQGNWIVSAVMLLPIFWLFTLLFFAVLAYFNWKCTKLGYCVKRRWIVLGSVFLSILFGELFYSMGLGKQLDSMMARVVPIYDQYKHRARRDLWQQPERGMLTGKIIEVDEDMEKLLVRDENGKNWVIDDSDVKWENEGLEEKGKIIKVIGQKTGEVEFCATEIRRCINCQDDEFIEEMKPDICFKSQDSGCSN